MPQTLAEVDEHLAEQYGPYASYATDVDPECIETYGDSPADEVDRLLDRFATPERTFLELGCGAGFTLCRVAPLVQAIWGFEEEADLLEATRLRIAESGITNATLVQGNVAKDEDVQQLPDKTFDVVLSRRGPNVTPSMLSKLKPNTFVIQELFQGSLGLLEAFGRKSVLADLGNNPRWLIDEYSWLGFFPVSIKEYYFDLFFCDVEHLAAYLSQQFLLFRWFMPPMPYVEERDRDALELYARFNMTPNGIRIVDHRKVFLFRRERLHYAPAAPEIEPNI